MIRRHQRSTRTATLFLYTTLCRSSRATDGFRCALPILRKLGFRKHRAHPRAQRRQHLAFEPRVGHEPAHVARARVWQRRSEEHTSELQSLMRISYAVFCLKKKKNHVTAKQITTNILYITPTT